MATTEEVVVPVVTRPSHRWVWGVVIALAAIILGLLAAAIAYTLHQARKMRNVAPKLPEGGPVASGTYLMRWSGTTGADQYLGIDPTTSVAKLVPRANARPVAYSTAGATTLRPGGSLTAGPAAAGQTLQANLTTALIGTNGDRFPAGVVSNPGTTADMSWYMAIPTGSATSAPAVPSATTPVLLFNTALQGCVQPQLTGVLAVVATCDPTASAKWILEPSP